MTRKHLVSDFKVEAAKGAPAVVGTVLASSGLTYSDVAAIATIAYIALQAAYLIYKWVREHRATKKG
jgi:hypothetical protein